MVIDTSAIVAVLFDEADRARFDRLIRDDPTRLVSAVTRVEATFVVEGRKREAGRERLERFFRLTAAEIEPVTPDQAELACEAFRRFGKGRHPAALNIGDCFAYALAKATGEPLLCKGDDFPRTDLALVA
ncbi:MAG: type II toxin-antitoxin system VapC family toxin [Geminicoccaceae bacterium]